jgi:polysaccharide pyruvyl transferase CsaB
MAQFRVGIIGSYGGMNLGDEAILTGILSELRRSVDADVVVFSRNAEDTERRHGVRAVDARRLSREEVRPEVAALDLLIFGGGGILYDAEAHIYLREVQLAEEAGVPVLVYAISVGPLEDADARRLVVQALQEVEVITVRDRASRKLLEDLGVSREMLVVADPALLIEPGELPEDVLEREGVADTRRLIGLSVREPGVAAPDLDEQHYQGLLADAADFMIGRYDANLLFLPMERDHKDMQHSHAVIAQMAFPQRATVLKGDYGPREMLALAGRLEFAVGMRLHFLIFAALSGVPFVPLPYSGKVDGFLEAFEIAMPTMKDVRAGQLIARIDHAWDLRHDLRRRIEANVPALQELAREPNRRAVALLGARSRRARDRD